MPANLNYTSLISSTLDLFIRDKVADNVIGNNALLSILQSKGKIRHEQGGRNFAETIAYAPNSTVQFQDPTDIIDTSGQDEITTALFSPKFLASTFNFTIEEKLKNQGSSAIVNLIKTKQDVLMSSIKNIVGSALFSDGTGNGGKTIGGLQLLIADDPTVGTVGGINRANNPWWRNQVYDFSTSAGSNASASNILSGMNSLYLSCQVQQNEAPDLILADGNYFSFFESATQQIQRITTPNEGKIGFQNLAYKASSVVYDPNTPANHMYFINTTYINFKHLNNPLFTKEETVRPVNQLTYITPVYLYGNLTSNSLRVHGVAKN